MPARLARVLMTGATGFIGHHLQRFLLDRGHSVRALVRPASVDAAGLDPRCERHVGELTDVRLVAEAMCGVDAVVYGAGAVRGRDYADFAAANVEGIRTMVAAAGAATQAPHLLLLSSLAASRPQLSHYAGSKRAGEEALRASALDWTILRPPAVYGPGDVEMRPLLALVRRGLSLRPGPPEQRLSLLHVADLAAAVAACLSHRDACRGQCFSLDDGAPGGYDWHDIAVAVAGRRVRQVGVPGWLLGGAAQANLLGAGLFGYRPMLTPGKVRELRQVRWVCDNRALSEATGWTPDIDLVAGAAALFS